MADRRRIAVATFGRSDFSILRPLCGLLVASDLFDVGLLVGGAHFEEVSGRTITDVEASGIPVWARVDPGIVDRSPLGAVRVMSEQMSGFAAAVDSASPRPDLVVILGDRYEAVAAGLAMVPLGVPVAHISGGSVTEGAIDDVFRHCLTKIAALHFCDLPEFALRIHRMGESADRIFTTGALGLDAFVGEPRSTFEEFTARFSLVGLEPGYTLMTLHPESRHPDRTGPMCAALVSALRATDRQVVATYPNADPGADEIVEQLLELDGDSQFHVVRSFGPDWYPTAMAHASLMIGNSSGGIIEAASFGLPVVDIGHRQGGRDHGANVLHSERDEESIGRAIEQATEPSFVELVASEGNIYGDGRAAERVLQALTSVEWSIVSAPKPFVDPDPAFRGSRMECT